MEIVLASKSKGRKRVLEALGLNFIVDVSNADESLINETTDRETVIRIAELKAEAVAKRHEDALIIAADTLVSFDGERIGQPRDDRHAKDVIKRLLGSTHEVHTGICMIRTGDNKKIMGYEVSYVTLKNVKEAVVDSYINAGRHRGKAGAYNIEDAEFECFVEDVKGSASNIIGLPVEAIAPMLKEFGIDVDAGRWNEGWNARKGKI